MEYSNLIDRTPKIRKRVLLDWLYKQNKEVSILEVSSFIKSNSIISQEKGEKIA